jgi:hypothetical protein
MYKLLRLALLLGALGWCASFTFTLSPWQASVSQLMALGADEVAYQPLLAYWLKMASVAFGSLGIIFAAACLDVKKYAAILPLLGRLSLLIGTVLLGSAIAYEISPGAYPVIIADICFCYLVGGGITIALGGKACSG